LGAPACVSPASSANGQVRAPLSLRLVPDIGELRGRRTITKQALADDQEHQAEAMTYPAGARGSPYGMRSKDRVVGMSELVFAE